MEPVINKTLYWTPRVLSILFLLFLSLFSLDVISPEYSIREIIIGLLMHNIPVFALLIILIIAWKYEIVGAIAWLLTGLLYIGLLLMNTAKGNGEWYMLAWVAQLSGPAFLIAYLFWLGWKKRKS